MLVLGRQISDAYSIFSEPQYSANCLPFLLNLTNMQWRILLQKGKRLKCPPIRNVALNPGSYTEGDKKLALYNLHVRIRSSASLYSHGNCDVGDISFSIPSWKHFQP